MPAKLKASRLQPGDTVMLVSPAAGLAGIFPHRADRAIAALEQLDYRVIEGPNARISGGTAGTPQQRAADIHSGITDPAVKAIIAHIGGDYVCHEILPFLDWDLIRQNPKIFTGFSDITSLLLAIYQQTGLVTFYGPMAITQLGDYPEIQPYTRQNMLNVLANSNPVGALTASPEWTDELLDWGEKQDLTRPRLMQASQGWEWLQAGEASGKLLGGCIQILVKMLEIAPAYLPDFSDCLFFWESAEKEIGVGYSPDEVAADLQKLKESGLLSQMRGMIIGRPYQYSPEWQAALKTKIVEIVGDASVPIVYNLEIGHTDPILTIPIGVQARLNSAQNLFTLEEAGVI